jgi:hypothetical protein
MSTIKDYKVMRDGEWVDTPRGEWEIYTGRRKMNILGYQIGWVEYHGPCYEAGKVSRAVRECRCDSCTLFEKDRYEGLSHSLRSIVDSMLIRDHFDMPGTGSVAGPEEISNHGGIPEDDENVEAVGSPSDLLSGGATIPDVNEGHDDGNNHAHLEQEKVADSEP